MSEYQPETWTTRGLLTQFCEIDNRMEDRNFAFIIGAGASVPSGIDSGAELVGRWLEELKVRLSHNDDLSLEEWGTAGNLGIDGFEYRNAASFYPQVFERRFRGHHDEGFAYLEEVMEGKEPSIGYSVLAKVLAETRHKVVITTNFDNLVADALATYTMKHPLVAGHESLSGFISTRPRRPLVAKIHRDLFLAPINDGSVDTLKEGWDRALKRLFEHYTPIVIGYGGNDGSLMELLLDLPEGTIPGGIFWCHRKGKPPTDKRILEAVAKQNGKLVPIIGFDEFMLELGSRLGYPPLADELESQGRERVKRYKEQFETIHKRINEENNTNDEDSKDLKQSVNATADKQKDWWGWQLRINEEGNPDIKEKLYREAIDALPRSHELIGNFAIFLFNNRKNNDEVEKLYKLAIEISPNDEHHLGQYANFVKDIKKNYDEAEKLYRKALDANKSSLINLVNYANFLWEDVGNHKRAEFIFLRALLVDPDYIYANTNLSEMLIVTKRANDAREYALKAATSNSEFFQARGVSLLQLAAIASLNGELDTYWLQRLKGLLNINFERGQWRLERFFNSLKHRLIDSTLDFYNKIGEAIIDESALPKLEKDERWQALDPISPDTPWEE